MTRTRAFTLACSMLLAAPFAFSQSPAGPPPDGQNDGQRPMFRSGGPMGRGEGRGMGIVPPGTWWKNPEIASNLGLSAEQQKKMDDVFLQSRLQLIQTKASLEEEQVKLEPLLNTNPFDQSRAFAQISKIADLRAELEKTDAKMLLSLRSLLTPDQWTKMQAQIRQHRGQAGEGMRGLRRPEGGNPPAAPGPGASLPPGLPDSSPAE